MFDKEKDIFYSAINKDYQQALSFYYDEHNKFTNFLKQVYAVLKISLRQFKNIFAQKSHRESNFLKKNVWFYINSKNNFHSVNYIFERLQKQSVYVSYGSASFATNKSDLRKYSSPTPSFRGYLFLLYILINPKYSARELKLIYRSFHLYKFYSALLKQYKPKLIVFSNDHTPNTRALIIAAKDLGIKTLYLQHASVNNHFPPLKFSISILDGAYSHLIYQQIGKIEGDYRVVGMPRFKTEKGYIHQGSSTQVIGIAFNMRDSLTIITALVNFLLESFPDKTIIIRSHPREKRELNLPHDPRIIYSKIETEKPLDYLRKLDVLIGNNSSILLEAAILNVYPIQYNLSNGVQTDNYGYIKNQMVDEAQTLQEVYMLISAGRREGLYYRNRAKFYDESIGTGYEFGVQEHVLDIVTKYAASLGVDADQPL